jgi:asparagine synthase (glutamine-hydrolysing)
VLELSLRTPLYVLRGQRCDRAVARSAFSGDIPPEISRRSSKAFGDNRMREMLTRNMDVFRDLLLDGHLVQEHVLDRARLAEVLSDDPTSIPTSMIELFSYLSVETFVRAWNASPAATSTVLRRPEADTAEIARAQFSGFAHHSGASAPLR